MTSCSYYMPYSEFAAENGMVVMTMALIKGEITLVPEKQRWCYRYEIKAYDDYIRGIANNSTRVHDFGPSAVESEGDVCSRLAQEALGCLEGDRVILNWGGPG